MGAREPFFRPRLAFSRAQPAPPAADPARLFREAVLPHMDAAYNFARYLCRDATAAEDIVQEAFLRSYRAFPGWRGDGARGGSAKAWLFAIVRNCFLTWAAGAGSGGRVVSEGSLTEAQAEALANVADPDQPSPEEALLRRRDAETIRAVVEELPEPFRETLVLRELEELSYKEIAALTAAPIGTVMSRLARARQMLADMLLPEGARTAQEVLR